MEVDTSQHVKHIPSIYFSTSIGFKQRMELKIKYSSHEWDTAKWFLSETRQITKSGLKIASVLKTKLGFDIFPMVRKVACRGFDISGGTAAFCMYGKNGEEYLFGDRAKYYKSIRGVYKITEDKGSTWIYRMS